MDIYTEKVYEDLFAEIHTLERDINYQKNMIREYEDNISECRGRIETCEAQLEVYKKLCAILKD